MKTAQQAALCIVIALLLAPIALGQQDYIGRYDVYTGFMYLSSPLISLGESGVHTRWEPIRRNGTHWGSTSARGREIRR